MQTTHPLVTIGIPTYNRASGRLGAALQCALGQTYSNIEIIVADNCSTDNTEAFVASHNSDKIRYIKHETNIGPINNFNSCLENAHGEYFLLFHDDDAIDPDFIDCCVKAIQGRHNVGLVRTGIRIIDGDGNVKSESRNNAAGLTPAELFSAWFNQETVFYLPCTLFNTEKLKKEGGIRSPHGMFCDVFAEAKLIANYERIDVPDVKASFRRHDQNFGSSAKNINAWCQDSLMLIDLICRLLPDDEKILRVQGKSFLCCKCYHQTRRMTASPWWKALMYVRVMYVFGGAYSLLDFYRKYELNALLGPIKKRVFRKSN